MNHAKNKTISHQDSHAGKGRNARGRKAITRPPSRCGLFHAYAMSLGNPNRPELGTRKSGERQTG